MSAQWAAEDCSRLKELLQCPGRLLPTHTLHYMPCPSTGRPWPQLPLLSAGVACSHVHCSGWEPSAAGELTCTLQTSADLSHLRSLVSQVTQMPGWLICKFRSLKAFSHAWEGWSVCDQIERYLNSDKTSRMEVLVIGAFQSLGVLLAYNISFTGVFQDWRVCYPWGFLLARQGTLLF